MRKWLLTGSLLLALLPVQAQFLAHNRTVFDLGDVETGRVVRQNLTFRNGGLVPMHIVEVLADCGLTVVSYPKGLIQPAERFVVTVDVQTDGRTGKLIRQLRLLGSDGRNGTPSTVLLSLVPPKQKPVAYADTLGVLAAEWVREVAGPVSETKSKDLTLRVQNISNKPLTLLTRDLAQQPFLIEPAKWILTPGEQTTLTLRYRKGGLASLQTYTGLAEAPFEVPLYLYTDEAGTAARKRFVLTGTYVAASQEAPQPELFAQDDVSQKVVAAGPELTYRFTLRNKGAQTIRVNEVLPTRGVKVVRTVQEVAPGKQGSITLAVATKGRKGRLHRTVTVRTSAGEQVLHMRAQIGS